MAKYTFLDLATDVARVMPEPMATTQMWEFAVAKGMTQKLDSQGKTPEATFGARAYGSLGDPDSPFIGIGRRPVLFWLKERGAPPVAASTPAKPAGRVGASEPNVHERDLHPLVAYVAFNTLDRVRVKTIHHEGSSKKAFAEWLHPDLIGARFPELEDATARFGAATRTSLVETVSIEVKRALGFSSLRESFFQAVSNSSWAHEGYLAVASIDSSPEFQAELSRLSAAFGVGVLVLDAARPDDSHVLFSARRRDRIDWDTLDKLVELNPDVREFVENAAIDLESKKVRESDYDLIPKSAEELAKKLKAFWT